MVQVLVITSQKILPANGGGKLGSLGLIRYLHDIGENVILASFYEGSDYTEAERNELLSYVQEIHMVKLRWSNIALNLSFKYPNSIRKYVRSAMFKCLEKLKENYLFDWVIIDHLQLFEYTVLFNQSRIILHTHNVESDLWWEYARRCKGIIKWFVNRSARMMYKYECKALKAADCITACSETDLAKFKEMVPNCNAAVMHPYIKINRVKYLDDIMCRSNMILFIGGYSWYPNEEAGIFLADELMPELRKRIPGIKLFLVGDNPTEKMRKLAAENDDIYITGHVKSVDEYIKQADVFVNAVTQGSGINIKMIDAMGRGIPIVSTEFGARGLNLKHGQSVLIFNNSKECADYIEELVNDRSMAARMADEAEKSYKEIITPSGKVKGFFKD